MARLSFAAFIVLGLLFCSSTEGRVSSPILGSEIVPEEGNPGALFSQSADVSVTIEIVRLIEYGQGFVVTGNISQLGNWNVSDSPLMSVTNDNIWTYSLTLSAGTAIEFKLVLVYYNSKEIIKWMPDPNLVMTVTEEYESELVIVYWDPSSSSVLKQSL